MTRNIPHYHLLTVKYIGPSNVRGGRVKISSDRFEDSKTIPYNHKFNCARDNAEEYLTNKGYNIVGSAEGKKVDYLITDTFKGLREHTVKHDPGFDGQINYQSR